MPDHKVNHTYEVDKYAMESMHWYGWGSPVGLSIMLVGIGVFVWFLHLAKVIH
jgi:hypothetical protein